MKPITVLIVDDHSIVREGLRQFINRQQDMEVIAEAVDGLQALEKVKALHPDVLLLDLAMPNMNGLEVIALIREDVPDTHIVVLSMHATDRYVHQALRSGARGYVLKASPSVDILEAIRKTARGEYFLSSKIRTEVIEMYSRTRQPEPTSRGYDLLTEREQQIFRLVVEGQSTRNIAELLHLSPKTVEKQRSSITRKLGIHGRLEMLKYAIKIGIVNPDLWGDDSG